MFLNVGNVQGGLKKQATTKLSKNCVESF